MEMRDQKTLNEKLKGTGMKQAFESDVAGFTGISREANLFVTTMIHEAYLTFSEEGTEAAAATGVSVGMDSSSGGSIVLDRPFLFAIEDKMSGSLLLMDNMTDPREL